VIPGTDVPDRNRRNERPAPCLSFPSPAASMPPSSSLQTIEMSRTSVQRYAKFQHYVIAILCRAYYYQCMASNADDGAAVRGEPDGFRRVVLANAGRQVVWPSAVVTIRVMEFSRTRADRRRYVRIGAGRTDESLTIAFSGTMTVRGTCSRRRQADRRCMLTRLRRERWAERLAI
jgi:hypothetical protein